VGTTFTIPVPGAPVKALDTTYAGSKKHRTAVFVDATAESVNKSAYLGDRVKRLLESFNPPGSGMMSDRYAVIGEKLYRITDGATIIAGAGEIGGFNAQLLSNWAAKQSYDLTIIVTSPGRALA